MGRRDRDPRPPVEVLGAGAPEDDVQHVAVGGGGGGKGPLVAVLAVAVLVASLALGGGGAGDESSAAGPQRDDDREADREGHREGKQRQRPSSTTTRPRRTATTTSPPPVAVLPGADAHLLLLGSPRGAELLDLETGVARTVEMGGDVWSAVAVRGGAVVVDRGQAVYHPLPEGEPVELGEAEQVHASGPDAVWLVTQRGVGPASLARLVDLAGQVLAGPLGMEQGWIVGPSGDGLAVAAGGRVYELARDGAVAPIGTGEPLAASGGWLMLRTCDDTATCGLELHGPGGPRTLSVVPGGGRAWLYGAGMAVRPDGRRAAAIVYGPSTSLVWLDLERGTAQELADQPNVSTVAWLPAELGAVAVKQSEVTRLYERDGEVVAEVLRDAGADHVVVIPR